jgi:hypothetical protein
LEDDVDRAAGVLDAGEQQGSGPRLSDRLLKQPEVCGCYEAAKRLDGATAHRSWNC